MKTILFIFLFFSQDLSSEVLTVGSSANGYDYERIPEAASNAEPGDTIKVFEYNYESGNYITDLKGTEDKPIVLMAAEDREIIISGGSQAFHFVNPEWLMIKGFIFERQTANGVNLDDGGDYSTPAHRIIIENCIFRDMDANQNNDLLKLSGLDNFIIRKCRFENGSPGGSMIDMVGCHEGIIEDCRFENGGSNSIQAKGGCEKLIIRRNYFEDGGQRSINIGGSTGLLYFRPLGTNYEAARIMVHSNIFIGSVAPIAFVGAIECNVFNNTIIEPEKWVIRILQESDDQVFLPCGNNDFFNNIVRISNASAVYTLNIGANTDPESFYFAANLWYNFEDEQWSGPNLPVDEYKPIIGQDPMFKDLSSGDFNLLQDSPAIGKGVHLNETYFDYDSLRFSDPPSIGCFEYKIPDAIENINSTNNSIKIWPQPATEKIFVQSLETIVEIEIQDSEGRKISADFEHISANSVTIRISDLAPGFYLIFLNNDPGLSKKLIISR